MQREAETRDSKKCLTFTGHTDEIMGVLYPTSNTIISGAGDGGLIVWDVPSGTRRYTLSNGGSRAVPLKAHDSMLVSATHDGAARIWDLQTGQCTHVLQGHKERVSRAEFNADGSLLATGAHPGEMNIWNTKTG
jgi:WD40 repeat protein